MSAISDITDITSALSLDENWMMNLSLGTVFAATNASMFWDMIQNGFAFIGDSFKKSFKIASNKADSLQSKYTSEMYDFFGTKLNKRILIICMIVVISLVIMYVMYRIIKYIFKTKKKELISQENPGLFNRIKKLLFNSNLIYLIVLYAVKIIQTMFFSATTQKMFKDFDSNCTKLNTILWSSIDNVLLYDCVKDGIIEENIVKNLSDYVTDQNSARENFKNTYPNVLEQYDNLPDTVFVPEQLRKDMEQKVYNSIVSRLDTINIAKLKYSNIYVRSMITYAFLCELKKKDNELIEAFITTYFENLQSQNDNNNDYISRYNVYNLVKEFSVDIVIELNFKDIENTFKAFHPEKEFSHIFNNESFNSFIQINQNLKEIITKINMIYDSSLFHIDAAMDLISIAGFTSKFFSLI